MEKRGKHNLFLINKKSGTDASVEWETTLSNFFTENDPPFSILYLPEKINLAELKNKILQQMPGAVIAVGGDGTVSMAANIIACTGIPLGIIPQGSANGMAVELGIPIDVQKALEVIRNCVATPCDLIEIKGHCYCLHIADAGLNAHLIKHFDENNKRGMLGYSLVIFKTLWRKRKLKVKFSIDGVLREREAFMVALANASKFGTGAVINPEGKLDDGFFEIVVVRHLNFWALMKMLFHPGLFNPEKIEIFKVQNVHITSRHAMHFQIDGEYKGRVKTVDAVVAKKALNIFVGNKQNQ